VVRIKNLGLGGWRESERELYRIFCIRCMVYISGLGRLGVCRQIIKLIYLIDAIEHK